MFKSLDLEMKKEQELCNKLRRLREKKHQKTPMVSDLDPGRFEVNDTKKSISTYKLGHNITPVSYTHLTMPTINLV